MRQLQVFLPKLNGTLGTRAAQSDMQRAFDTWNEETTIWLLPDLDRKTRWDEGANRRVVAIPAETLERIDVYHFGANGNVVGPWAKKRFPQGRADGLLSMWLNYEKLGGVTQFRAPEAAMFAIPHVSENHVKYGEVRLAIQPRGFMPIARIDESTHTVTTRWPPESAHFATVSPDSESEEWFGPLERIEDCGTSCSYSTKHQSLALFKFLHWPAPLDELVPVADGVDNLLAQAQMVAIARQSETDLAGATIRAKRLAGYFVFEGHTSLWSAVMPTYAAGGEEAVLAKVEDFGIIPKTFAELSENSEYRRKLAERIEIRRAWGPLGLFWALLLDQLESRLSFRSCRNCQRIIGGSKGKHFCGPDDDPACFKRRRAADKRRSREAENRSNSN